MKIKSTDRTYAEVMALPRTKRRKPRRPMWLLGAAIRLASIPALLATRFSYRTEPAGLPKEPCLILMNHSAFLDLKIAYRIFFPRRRFAVVCTTDALVGKPLLMRLLGCIPTQKFVTDLSLIRDIKYMLGDKRTSVLMYPEAGYSFDGRATVLPDQLGGFVKLLGVPVVTVITKGAFLRDPLYNGLRLRRVKVSAEVKCLFTAEEVAARSSEEIMTALREEFSFDSFATQYAEGVRVTEPFRAEGLHRILYKCPACGAEGEMEGKGITLTCHACGKAYTLTELGRLEATGGETEYPHIPDWFSWERACVRAELEAGDYRLDVPVRIGMMVDEKSLYMIGGGRLAHDASGFRLTSDDGALTYEQKPLASHCLNADFFWYEIGDVIGIGNRDALYYCFPEPVDGRLCPVAKARLAAEELYKMEMEKKRSK